MRADVEPYWGKYASEIGRTFERVVGIGLPEDADFFWIILHPGDLRGLPLTINPATRDLQADDGWEHEDIFMELVPSTVGLPDDFTATPDAADLLRDSVAGFLSGIWKGCHIASPWRFLFSMSDDGWFFDLETGGEISAWDVATYLK